MIFQTLMSVVATKEVALIIALTHTVVSTVRVIQDITSLEMGKVAQVINEERKLILIM